MIYDSRVSVLGQVVQYLVSSDGNGEVQRHNLLSRDIFFLIEVLLCFKKKMYYHENNLGQMRWYGASNTTTLIKLRKIRPVHLASMG
jgi:hypothetical protein